MFHQMFDVAPPTTLQEDEPGAWRAEFMRLFSQTSSFTITDQPPGRAVLHFEFANFIPGEFDKHIQKTRNFIEQWRSHSISTSDGISDRIDYRKAAQLIGMGAYWNMAPLTMNVTGRLGPSLEVSIVLVGPNARPNAP